MAVLLMFFASVVIPKKNALGPQRSGSRANSRQLRYIASLKFRGKHKSRVVHGVRSDEPPIRAASINP